MSDRRVCAATISRRPLSGTCALPSRSAVPPIIPSRLTGVGTHDVTLIPGDGVGSELVDAARAAIEATGVDVRWDVQTAGLAALQTDGDPLPERVIGSIRDRGVALKGPL